MYDPGGGGDRSHPGSRADGVNDGVNVLWELEVESNGAFNNPDAGSKLLPNKPGLGYK